MIDSMIRGRLVQCVDSEEETTGRIVVEDDKPIHIHARRGTVRRELLALPMGLPLAVAGTLTTSIAFDKKAKPYVRHDIEVTALLTPAPAQPAPPERTGFVRSILKGSK